jgi:ADP-heptose:LPS heptosyltransferase
LNCSDAAKLLKKPGASILVCRVDHLGDTLLYTPALADLRAAYPHCRITALANPLTLPALQGNPCIDGLLLHEDGPGPEAKNFHSEMRKRNFDVVISFSAAVKDYREAYGMGGKFRIAPVYKSMLVSVFFSTFFIHHRVFCPDDPGKFQASHGSLPLSHEVEQNRKISEALKAPTTGGGLFLGRSEEDSRFAAGLLGQAFAGGSPQKVIGLQLSDRWFWDGTRPAPLTRLAKEIARAFPGHHLLCFSYPGMEGLGNVMMDELQRESGNESRTVIELAQGEGPPASLITLPGLPFSFARNLPLKKFASVLSQLKMLVTVHSGATHISAAAGTPSVVIFEERYSGYYSCRECPWNVSFEAVTKGLPAGAFAGLGRETKREWEDRHISGIIEACRRLEGRREAR